jgi:hypothetical protein
MKQKLINIIRGRRRNRQQTAIQQPMTFKTTYPDVNLSFSEWCSHNRVSVNADKNKKSYYTV